MWKNFKNIFHILILIFFIFPFNSISKDFQLIKIIDLKNPWGMDFINNEELIISERNGQIVIIDLPKKTKEVLTHNLNFMFDSQGGLLDILHHKNKIFICYSEKLTSQLSTTSIAVSEMNEKKLFFSNIFQSSFAVNSGYHYGCRMQLDSESNLYASVGERGQGNIAQNFTEHPGSIIKIKLDGSVPEDNPKFIKNRKWLPELFQIGVRNPQGMTYDPVSKKIFITNHGPRGGDFFGEVVKGSNYGWNNWCWGGRNYNFTKCGIDINNNNFFQPLKTWVPSIGISAVKIYYGNEFPHWNGMFIIGSLKKQSLEVFELKNNKLINNSSIIKNKIGRVRDIEINPAGQIFLLSNDKSALWILKK